MKDRIIAFAKKEPIVAGFLAVVVVVSLLALIF